MLISERVLIHSLLYMCFYLMMTMELSGLSEQMPGIKAAQPLDYKLIACAFLCERCMCVSSTFPINLQPPDEIIIRDRKSVV